MIQIVADSSVDMNKTSGKNYALEIAPLCISANDKHFVDDENLDVDAMVEFFRKFKDKSGTACPSVASWIDCFNNQKEIIIFTITSGLSGSYNSAQTAVSNYLADQKDSKVYIFDTLSTGPEIRLNVEKAIELAEKGLSFEEIVETLKNYRKRTRLFFSLQSLHNMAQNGRVSKMTAAIVGVLGIKILGTASKVGTLQPVAKCRTNNALLKSLHKELQDCKFNGGKVYIAHVNNLEFAQQIKDFICANYQNVEAEIYKLHGLNSYYAEYGSTMVGVEGTVEYK